MIPFRSRLFYDPRTRWDSSHHLTAPDAFVRAFQSLGPAWGQVFMILVHEQQHFQKVKLWDVEPPTGRAFPPPSSPCVRTLCDTGEASSVSLSKCCALRASPPEEGGVQNHSVFISIFQPVLTDRAESSPEGQRLAGTPAAAAQGSSSYLIQLVHAGADRPELAVWDTANCKHPVEDAPIVDLGRGSEPAAMNSGRCSSCSRVLSSLL